MNMEFIHAGFRGCHSSVLVRALGICFAALAMVYGIVQIAERSGPIARAAIASTSDNFARNVELPSVSEAVPSATGELPRVGMLAERVDDPRQCKPEDGIGNACIYQ